MKTREIILILVAAAFGGVAIVTWSGEAAANQRAAKISEEANEARLKSVADIKALNDKAAAVKKATDEASATLLAQTKEAVKQAVEVLAKAKADAANRINELTAELAHLRNGSELKDAFAKQKKADDDLADAATALRNANAKTATALARVAELQEENRRLREQSKGTDNASPNYRAL